MGFKLVPRECSRCGQWISQQTIDRRKLIKGTKVSQAAKRAKTEGKPFGIPRKFDYNKIYELRDQKMSINNIAFYLRASRGSVQHALRIRGK